MSLREPVKVIADILQSEMAITQGQIMLGYQKWGIPENSKLYVALSYISGKAIAVGNDAISNGSDPDNGMTEQQSVTMHHLIQIDLLAFNKQDGSNEARTRKEEVIMALRSLAAQAAMEVNNLQIARIPGQFSDVSSVEETAFVQRFTMTIAVTSLHVKEKAVADYYNTFRDPEVHLNA